MVFPYRKPPAQDFCKVDSVKMGLLPGINSLPPTSNPPPAVNATLSTTAVNENSDSGLLLDDPSKKFRKPYTITKSRESWTDQEHEKFVEALHLFDRDWKKIDAFVGSKTVIQESILRQEDYYKSHQICFHAQKYFLKVQKNGANEHVPPPRPKRKAAHPYPHKAPKNTVSHVRGPPFQSSADLLEPGNVVMQDSLSEPKNLTSGAALSPWTYSTIPPVSVPHCTQADDVGLSGPAMSQNCCSSSIESTPEIWPTGGTNNQGKVKQSKTARERPDFAQVYRFIGGVFNPNASGHLQKLKMMDPMNVETVLLLMENLCANLTSPEFENHRKLLSSYDVDAEKVTSSLHAVRPGNAISSS